MHVVPHGGSQWRDYLRLWDLLRRSPAARQRYEDVKVELVATHVNDREAYTEGKTGIVGALLLEADSS